MILQKCLCVIGAIVFFADLTAARWVEETISTSDDWSFVTRFCFLSKQGALMYNFVYPVSYGTQEILLYYDEPGQWESVYKSGKNCSERRSMLSIFNNQIIALNTSNTVTSRYSGCSLTTVNGAQYYNCSGGRTFRSMRERWWYIAVARCDNAFSPSVSGLQLSYKLHMTNGEEGDLWHFEFSADEFYILAEDIAYLVIYLFMVIVSVVCAVVLKGRQLFHSTYKMYMVALSLWFIGLLFLCIAWGKYADSGWQEKPTEVTGRLLQAASNVIFILMLILLAKGYSITRGRLPHMSMVRVVTFFVFYIIVYITLFIWEGMFFDEGLVLYFYESPPGYGLVMMRLIGWLWFLYGIFFTLKHHSNKANFYFPFFVFYTLWFWAGPVVVLVAMFAMAKWSREKTVHAVEQFVGLCGHLFFLILTRPSAANTNFPYTVRTTQIGTMADPKEDESPQSNGSTYRMNGTYTSEETHVGTGPDLAALFVVQDARKSGFDENSNTGGLDNPGMPPSYSSIALPPLRAQAPQSTMPGPARGAALPPLRGVTLPPLSPLTPSAPLGDSSHHMGLPAVPPGLPMGPKPPAYDNMFMVKQP
ncbi:transmembrane protein 145-like [Littorina saxatilis]|uniref:Intimal thickness related receptor IRP domain-containing protein n=1 Tax=Littorina saxatilis TaxID=31220 RepID=A0AAN9GFK1_9CAEN